MLGVHELYQASRESLPAAKVSYNHPPSPQISKTSWMPFNWECLRIKDAAWSPSDNSRNNPLKHQCLLALLPPVAASWSACRHSMGCSYWSPFSGMHLAQKKNNHPCHGKKITPISNWIILLCDGLRHTLNPQWSPLKEALLYQKPDRSVPGDSQ